MIHKLIVSRGGKLGRPWAWGVHLRETAPRHDERDCHPLATHQLPTEEGIRQSDTRLPLPTCNTKLLSLLHTGTGVPSLPLCPVSLYTCQLECSFPKYLSIQCDSPFQFMLSPTGSFLWLSPSKNSILPSALSRGDSEWLRAQHSMSPTMWGPYEN